MRTAITAAALFVLTSLVAPLQARAETVKVEAFTFAVPEGWKSVTPSSPMRKAQLEIARGPEKAEVTFFHFGADQGGTAEDNVARWYAQFPGSEKNRITEHMQIGQVKITFAMTEGTFSSGMPGGPTTPMEGYALCGAILESAAGNVFVKMTGPNAVVKASTEAFKKMVTEAAKSVAPQAWGRFLFLEPACPQAGGLSAASPAIGARARRLQRWNPPQNSLVRLPGNLLGLSQ